MLNVSNFIDAYSCKILLHYSKYIKLYEVIYLPPISFINSAPIIFIYFDSNKNDYFHIFV